jgi:hypothetical protein
MQRVSENELEMFHDLLEGGPVLYQICSDELEEIQIGTEVV